MNLCNTVNFPIVFFCFRVQAIDVEQRVVLEKRGREKDRGETGDRVRYVQARAFSEWVPLIDEQRGGA